MIRKFVSNPVQKSLNLMIVSNALVLVVLRNIMLLLTNVLTLAHFIITSVKKIKICCSVPQNVEIVF